MLPIAPIAAVKTFYGQCTEHTYVFCKRWVSFGIEKYCLQPRHIIGLREGHCLGIHICPW